MNITPSRSDLIQKNKVATKRKNCQTHYYYLFYYYYFLKKNNLRTF